MSLNSFWRAIKPPPQPKLPKWERDRNRALQRLQVAPASDYSHVLVCFSDDTSYGLCGRYTLGMHDISRAEMEMTACAAIVLPCDFLVSGEEDHCELSAQTCPTCATILTRLVKERLRSRTKRLTFDKRIIWRDIEHGTVSLTLFEDNLGQRLWVPL
jgi:hypothetical protein